MRVPRHSANFLRNNGAKSHIGLLNGRQYHWMTCDGEVWLYVDQSHYYTRQSGRCMLEKGRLPVGVATLHMPFDSNVVLDMD